jgi:hypothetical protein
MRVRLTRKLADRINGIDLAGRSAGDVLNLPDRDALCLLAEGWAAVDERPARRNRSIVDTGITNSARRRRKRS